MMKSTIRFMAVAALATSFSAAHAGGMAGDPAKGKELSAPCAACHGPEGRSENPAFPTLAGQYPDYIVNALESYKDGSRKNPIMAGSVANLSEQDMKDLAEWYGTQKGALYTPAIQN